MKKRPLFLVSLKKPIVLFCFLFLFMLSACGSPNTEVDKLKQEIQALEQENAQLKGDSPNEEAPTNAQDKKIISAIWEFVKLEVKDSLKQPSTAEFPDLSKVKFYKIASDTYEVLGTVKGDNALGNTIENKFYATVIVDAKGQPTIINDIGFPGDDDFDKRAKENEQLQERLISGKSYLTAQELAEEVLKQPLYVTETKYLDSSSFRYSSYSMLQAILYNNSKIPIKNALIGFVAWDKNGLPIKLEHYSIGAYFQNVSYDTINLMPQETYTGKTGDNYYGMQIDEDLPVATQKAIVISYEDFDGNTWENPLLLDFKNLYEEKRLLD